MLFESLNWVQGCRKPEEVGVPWWTSLKMYSAVFLCCAVPDVLVGELLVIKHDMFGRPAES